MGDKEASFAGSRTWIGSFEVGFCVNFMSRVQQRAEDGSERTLTREIECRSVHMGGAAELAEPSNARLLLAHFERVGTPVMIGVSRRARPIPLAFTDALNYTVHVQYSLRGFLLVVLILSEYCTVLSVLRTHSSSSALYSLYSYICSASVP